MQSRLEPRRGGEYDGKAMTPAHLHWSFGGLPYTSPVSAQSAEFHFWFDSMVEERDFDFRQEVVTACSLLDAKRNGRPIALCFSGGVDSEIIARTLKSLGIPFTAFFLNIWNINRESFDRWCGCLAEFGAECVVIDLDKIHFYENHALEVFREFGVESPTYLAMAYLFNQIPSDHFIISGDGDLHRTGSLFKLIAEKNLHFLNSSEMPMPFSAASVFNYLWAAKNKRAGEFCFFSSTPGIIAAMAAHPLFERKYPFSSTSHVLHAAFPEIKRRPKTTNWDNGAYIENVWIREWLRRHASEWPDFAFWRGEIGTVANVGRIFKSNQPASFHS